MSRYFKNKIQLQKHIPTLAFMIGFCGVAVAWQPVHAQAVLDAPERRALKTQLGPRSVMLAGEKGADRIVLVGERGLIIFSGDAGKTWQQADVPVSVTLTNIHFATDKVGYVSGHGGVVLKTLDGGLTWSRVLDGKQSIKLLLEAVNTSTNPDAEAIAKQFEADGPDKPLFDFIVTDADTVEIVGAYGLALKTEDGGKSWTSWSDKLDNPLGYHLYSLRKSNERILVAGERGVVLLSTDKGDSFTALITPYEGSFFTAELLGDTEIIVAGLRGNIWKSSDNGVNWVQIPSVIPASVTGSLVTSSGKVMMVNQAGFMMQEIHGKYVPVNKAPMPSLTGLIDLSEGNFLALSVKGLIAQQVGVKK